MRIWGKKESFVFWPVQCLFSRIVILAPQKKPIGKEEIKNTRAGMTRRWMRLTQKAKWKNQPQKYHGMLFTSQTIEGGKRDG